MKLTHLTSYNTLFGPPYQVCLILPPTTSNLHATAALEGIFLGAYKDNRWRTEKKAPSRCAESVYLSSQVKLDIASIRCVCEGIIFTRQLVNAPPNVLKPAVLAQCMTECADRYGMDIKILEREDCEGLGMGLYLGVAQGATSDPKFIHVKYNPPNKPVKSVALVGKGICFDSGGYNLKTGPDSMINLMKFDMGGAATIFGAARAIAHLKIPDVEVHFITASCENMVSGHAYRPGDVLTASNGKTVEVVNTDAEGRMTLGDALVYADKLGVDYIVDVATLTGSVIVGLGNEYAGLFTPHDEIASLLAKAASDTGESLWRMPFVRAYRKLLDSSIADVKQCHTRPGDCINAAVMLNEFVSEETQWAHCDIAGTSWNFAENCATGYGVRTLVSFIKGLDRSQKQ
uniref:Cytosol aminopeptidase domain-containing protein n=2 Tax=Rhodosorus marinus TaxID=101924 RepID=A0A7S2ZI22_9RHOD|mmetsp:Transcript_20300/g.81844  ORF Transcript_20300/g.81844 Transcript_20300/m.81844 type:complete len:402 (+) Transcript_20300:521-1726(+)